MYIHPKDKCPQGEPETVVYLPTGTLLGLHIKGFSAAVMLGIREDNEGQPVSCAVTTELYIDTSRVPLQSNPFRLKHGYGAIEDDGA